MNLKNVNFHNNPANSSNNDINNYLSSISPFIIEGEFNLQIPKIKEKYSLQNFHYLTDINNNLIIIGKGGYGKLYLSKNVVDNKKYAIKNISKKKMKEVGVDTSIIKREIDAHIRITHPHIIKLFSYLEDRYNFYLAMEYAPNGNLYKLIQQKNGMQENEAFHFFIQVVSAIHFLHINGYAHRDIKPENILLDENNEVKLCDFGWCVNVSKGERITFCGTYEYMAPEMINDEFYDMGIDIWSLGVLLYEMIHGYSPFRANYFLKDSKSAMKEIFMNIKNNNYIIERNISAECIDLIDKLLTIDPKKRIKINEIFLHPWVINKEKKYFPSFNRININIAKNICQENKDDNIDEEINGDIYIKIDNNSNNNYLKKNNLNNDNNYNNLNNNGIYFIKEKSKEIKEIMKKDENNENNNENNKYKSELFNKIKIINNERNKIRKNDFDSVIQKIEKKDNKSQNNFIHSINNSKIILEKKLSDDHLHSINNINNINISPNNSEIKPKKSHEFHINLDAIHKLSKNTYKNIYIGKRENNKKNIEEKKQLNINTRQGKKEAINYNKLNNKKEISFIYNKPRNNNISYTIKKLSKEKENHKIINEHNNKDKRAKSVEKSLVNQKLNFSSNKLNYKLLKEKNEQSPKIFKNNLNKNIYIKDDFHKFGKKVIHIKKRSFLNENNFKFTKNIEKTYEQKTNNEKEKSVQNIYYNTFYNCNFDNIPNKSINFNINKNDTYTNNFFIQINNNNIRNRNQAVKSNTDFSNILKSYSFKNNAIKNNSDIFEEKNKPNDLINYSTEKKVGKVYFNRINILRNEGIKNNRKYIITKSENKRYANNRKISPFKRKEIFISSYN